jgi:Zn-dependent protease with chaperone function
MHRHHLVGCGVGIALALVVVALAGGSAGSIGVLIALLICPLVMIGALMLLTRQRERDDLARQGPAADQPELGSRPH